MVAHILEELGFASRAEIATWVTTEGVAILVLGWTAMAGTLAYVDIAY